MRSSTPFSTSFKKLLLQKVKLQQQKLTPPALDPGLAPRDPVEFAREYLGFEPWPRQAEILSAIAQHPRVAVRSGHKVGKSTTAVVAGLWWYAAHRGARVVYVMPTGRQLRKVIWRELELIFSRAIKPVGGRLHKTPALGLVAADGRDLFGIATDSDTAFSGVSGEKVLYIVDEASGMSETIMEAIAGNRASSGSLLLLGNPTQAAGTFYRAFTEHSDRWVTLHVPSTEAVQWQLKHGAIPGLATQEWVDECRADGWEGTALWDVRVLGDFPTEGGNVVIGLGLVGAARDRWEDEQLDESQRLHIGVDPARFGEDESALVGVRGKLTLPPEVHRGLMGPQLAARVMDFVRLRRVPEEKPIVKVDHNGVGASCYDALIHFAEGEDAEIVLVGVNSSERATLHPPPGQPGYAKLRDQLWFGARAWLADGGTLPKDSKLEADLVAPRYGFTPDGRFKVESKDEMRKRLGRSPDRGDAFCMAVYHPPATSLEAWDVWTS